MQCQLNSMNRLAISIVLVLLLALCKPQSPGQEQSEPKPAEVELCVGEYYTESQAADLLNKLSRDYQTTDDWERRATAIRHQLHVGAGLDKIPEASWNSPIKAIRKENRAMDGYRVENVSLELFPGYFVNGNLYQPLEVTGRIPAILSPHGHWFKPEDYGRFREDMQLRCASLARMGAVVFAWDMYGTGEDIDHHHRSEEALTYQCFNGIRILDFITSLDFVDTERIGITGASGGGTQTFLIAALDERISVSVPTVMVSAHFFGGCVCESGKPIHKSGDFQTNNVEIAAVIAPKPLMIIGDGGDWTKNIATVEYPFIRKIYDLYDAGENTEYAFFENEVHDYGISKRKAAYGFLAKHLDLTLDKIRDKEKLVDESFVTLLDTTQLKAHPERPLVQQP